MAGAAPKWDYVCGTAGNASLIAFTKAIGSRSTDANVRVVAINPYDYAKKLLTLVTQVVMPMPNHISVTGHTDSNQFSRVNGYSNWELSADRANSTRRMMLDAGLPLDRFSRIVGKADREPLLANNPLDPSNRRISIVLLHQKIEAVAP